MWDIFEKNASHTLDIISKFIIEVGKNNSKGKIKRYNQ